MIKPPNLVVCPDCKFPEMWWSPIVEVYYCPNCQDLPIKNWVREEGGELALVDVHKRIEELNARDRLSNDKKDNN